MLAFVQRPLSIVNINQLFWLLAFHPKQSLCIVLWAGSSFCDHRRQQTPTANGFAHFGAAQECVGFVGKAKVRSPGNFKPYLTWLHRGLAWLAIVLALIFRNPGISSYEVFSPLFDGVGPTPIFIVLGIVLVASLWIKRPWCTYLCPLQPVYEIIKLIRRWIVELWTKTVRKTA